MLRPLSSRTINRVRRWNSIRLAHSLIGDLKSRGLVAQMTSDNLEKACQMPLTLYCGVDPSARSLHVGNLLPLITLVHFQRRGHKPIALVGGATGSIGDPGGRNTERKLLSREELDFNLKHIRGQVHSFFENASRYAARHGTLEKDMSAPLVVNNLDWFKDVPLLDFLRVVGKHAKVNTMISRDSVSSRLNASQGISFTEFTYQLLQAHDFYTLNQEHNCVLQIGGSDQWGNIVAGIDLIGRRRNADTTATTVEHEHSRPQSTGEEVFGLTIPLLTTPSGEKFGKSAGNAVWLDRNLTSVLDFYQFFIQVSDEMAAKLLPMFTFLEPKEISEILAEHETSRHERLAQRTLAREVTELVHGEAGVRQAEAATTALFQKEIAYLKPDDIVEGLRGDPRLVFLSRKDAVKESLTKLMSKHGRVKSRSEATNLLKSGGFYLNSQKVKDHHRVLLSDDLIGGRVAILRTGADNHLVLVLEEEAS